jgi:hypothetical protein
MTVTGALQQDVAGPPDRLRRDWADRVPLGIGGLYLVCSGIHIGMVTADTEIYRPFASSAVLPVIRTAWADVFMGAPTFWGLAVAAGELAIGLLLLAGGRPARIGFAGAIAFPLGPGALRLGLPDLRHSRARAPGPGRPPGLARSTDGEVNDMKRPAQQEIENMDAQGARLRVVAGFDGRWQREHFLTDAACEAERRNAPLTVITVLHRSGEVHHSPRDVRAEDSHAATRPGAVSRPRSTNWLAIHPSRHPGLLRLRGRA